MIKFNKEYFKRLSTYQNLAEAVCVVLVQQLEVMPSEMSQALWVALGLRLGMAAMQVISVGIKKDV